MKIRLISTLGGFILLSGAGLLGVCVPQAEGPSLRKEVRSADAPQPIGPYSQAIRAGDSLYLAGQIAMDPKTGKLIEGDIKEQTRRVLHNIKAVLQAGKAAFSDVVSVTVYMTDLKDFKEMNEVYQEYFSSPYPARATVGVAALPAGAKVEIGVIAHARSQ